jgi:N4-gp56 family major capsid protein
MPAPYMNTITVNSGTALTGGEAVKLTNHQRLVYSAEILWKAMPIMRFAQFAQYKEELGVQPGLTIQMMTYNNLKRGGPLTEGVRMVSQALSATTKQITVGERGNKITVTELALRASFTDIMNDATTALGRDMGLVLDCELRDVALTGGIGTSVIYGRADKNAAKIAARTSITNDNPVSVATIKDAVEILATANCPKFGGDFYIGFTHPHVSRNLRDDPAFIEVGKYANPDQILMGEIGRIEDVRFIETTLMPNGAAPTDDDGYLDDLDATATPTLSVDVFQTLIFGEGYYGFAVALPAEIRDGGVIDLGREHELGWYAIWGAGVLMPTYGVVIESC